ncbi:MAG: heavy metal-associated domain-containing protein [Candidatus Ozemobacteraceae bacterium]
MDITWKIEKMKCDSCVQSIAEALLIIEGISEITVDLNGKSVDFKANNQAVADLAKKALVKAGFPPKV